MMCRYSGGRGWNNMAVKVMHSNDLKYSNKLSILKLLRDGIISRADMASRLKLSRATVSSIVEELISSGFVSEIGFGKSTEQGGKKPVMLKLNVNAVFIAAVYFSYNLVEVAITDLQGNIGIKFPETEKIPGQKRGAQGVCHGQTDISGGSFFFHAVFQFPGHPVDLMSVFQDLPAFFCEMDSMIDPFKELTAQFGFQLFDLKGDRRLGKSQTVCGFCEAAQFRHIDKGS